MLLSGNLSLEIWWHLGHEDTLFWVAHWHLVPAYDLCLMDTQDWPSGAESP